MTRFGYLGPEGTFTSMALDAWGPAGVGESGRFRRVMTLPRAGRYRLRWRDHGDRNGRLLSAVPASPLITVG